MLGLTFLAAFLVKDPDRLAKTVKGKNPLASLFRNHRLVVPYIFAFADVRVTTH